MLRRLGVRGRLLLAFVGISAFAVIAAAAAMYSFVEVGAVLDRITRQRVPAALASLKLSRQAEQLVTAAPALLAVTSRSQQEEVSASIAAEVERLDQLLEDLRGSAIDAEVLAAIEPLVDGLRRNLDALDHLIAGRLAVGERKEQLLRRLSGANIATQRLVAPGILVMDSKVAQRRRAMDDPAPNGGGVPDAAAGELVDAITSFIPQQKAQIQLSSVNDTLLRAASAESPADLSLLAFPLRRSLHALETLAGELDPKLRPRLLERVKELRELAEGPESLVEARADELDLLANAEALLAENAELSGRLTDAVDQLVDGADRDIVAANLDALSSSALQRRGADRRRGAQSSELGADRVAVRRAQPDRSADSAQRQHARHRWRLPARAAATGGRRRRDRPDGAGARRVPRHRGGDRRAESPGGRAGAAAGDRRHREHLRGLRPVRRRRPAGPVQQPLWRAAVSGHARADRGGRTDSRRWCGTPPRAG